MEFTTIVEDIIFYNQSNGYAVCEIVYREKKAKLAGFMPNIAIGDNIKVRVEIKKEALEPYLDVMEFEKI